MLVESLEPITLFRSGGSDHPTPGTCGRIGLVTTLAGVLVPACYLLVFHSPFQDRPERTNSSDPNHAGRKLAVVWCSSWFVPQKCLRKMQDESG